MSTRFTLTNVEQEELRRCSYVDSCTARMVQFTSAFKRLALAEYARGKTPELIFREAGIPVDHFRPRYTKELLKRWRAIAKRYGMEHFDTEQRGKNGVALARWRDREKAYAAMSDKEKVAFLEAEVEVFQEIRSRFQLPPSPRSGVHGSRRRTSASSLDA